MKKYFLTIAKISLVLVYAVIIAGALVRMTGSGMGCPDWPKCFGYYIPPTDVEQLTWRPHKAFESGQVIIKDEALWVAKQDFTTAETYDASQWRPYTKHDYAIFNPTHTWIEYLNRLCGALAGIFVFVMAVTSFAWRKEKKSIVWLSWLSVFLMGFQGWLGATVVYSVLNPIKITLHMVVALVIVAVILQIIWKSKTEFVGRKRDAFFGNFLAFALVLTLIQIVLGTQVRQYVDEQVKVVGYDQMDMILQNPHMTFYFHRSFSIVVFLVNLFLLLRNTNKNLGFEKIKWVMWLLVPEIVSGIAMAYFDFPFGSQTVHLVIASILFGTQFYMLLEYRNLRKWVEKSS
ncbi:COX15/CtaA family protein [Flavobacterium sp. MAH-1]|uniref:COX15/CtaA family protein n=1 Tax=Flavobacterium agri TaxID=2743471 RepID=A0A7Y8Y257_9FLAO|nr:COX15/CtaA family protein [Flavobacterium agri]NUY81159.1 COX15/CtaA family protein [Flavobacterium agri]NYA71183.1 COX15/CtaA family protein [Flavobacterium agri]